MKWGITMKKSISFIMAAVIGLGTVSSVTGCSSKSSSSEKSAAQTTDSAVTTKNAVNATPETTSTTTTTTTTTLMPPMTQPVEILDGFDYNGDIFNISAGPDNTIFAQLSEINHFSVVVFDPVHNKTVRKLDLKDYNYEPLGMFSDGTIVTYSSFGGMKFNFYPEGKTEPEVVEVEGSDYYTSMYVDTDNDCVYWINDGGLSITKMDRKGNTSEMLADKGFVNIANIDTKNHFIKASIACEEAEAGAEYGLFSIEDGSLYSYISDISSECGLAANGCFDSITEVGSDVCCGTMDYYELPGGKYKKSYRISAPDSCAHSLQSDMGSPYLLLIRSGDNDTFGITSDICFVDPENGTLATVYDNLADESKAVNSAHGIYLPETGRWFINFNYNVNGIEKSGLMMADPELLKFGQQLEDAGDLQANYTPAKVGEGFREVRKLADEIEKEFGVRILVGNEVKNAEYSSGYVFDSVEDYDYNTPEDEIYNLNELREVLRMYPEGFFEHFKASNGQCGLRIVMVEDLRTDMYSTFSAGGIAYDTGGWYNIVLGHTSFGYASTSFHHEMLHSVESLVSKKYPLDSEKWNALNPYGFDYTHDFDAYMTDSEIRPEIFSYAEGTDKTLPYFISNYSRVTPMEDRATLIEHLFSWDNDDDTFETYHQNDVESYKDYPHLKAKLDFLADWTKQEFGYVYWEETLKNFAASNKQPW